jgi:hypothetical protein
MATCQFLYSFSSLQRVSKGNETRIANKPNSKIILSPISQGMVAITTSDYIQIIAAGIYAAALFYTVITFRRSKKLDQITQTNIITSSWRDAEVELDKIPPGSEYDTSRKQWVYRIINDIEWLCFLINEKFISDKKILKQLEPTLIEYYENTFLRYVSRDEKDSKRYPEFTKLYQTIKQQQ